jgi:hypothetical protein
VLEILRLRLIHIATTQAVADEAPVAEVSRYGVLDSFCCPQMLPQHVQWLSWQLKDHYQAEYV